MNINNYQGSLAIDNDPLITLLPTLVFLYCIKIGYIIFTIYFLLLSESAKKLDENMEQSVDNY